MSVDPKLLVIRSRSVYLLIRFNCVRGRTYFYFPVEPVERFFCSEAENQDYLALNVEAGKTYFLQQKVEAGIWKARTNLVVMTEEEGKKKLADVHLSVFEKKAK